ncbi:MAG: Dabb family protein [Salinivirgaceae bacterium]|nr:Dabb family protein [Salinivirgaceae bacterium]
MIRHIVMWTLKENHFGKSKLELAQEMRERLLELKEKIKEIKSLEVELNAANFERNHDISLLAEYESFEQLKIYSEHLEHQKAVKFIREISTARACVDYEI